MAVPVEGGHHDRLSTAPGPLIAEIRRVLAHVFITAAAGIDHILAWSAFRITHQTRALISHHRRRGHPLPAEMRM
jgi:hypothetical protein